MEVKDCFFAGKIGKAKGFKGECLLHHDVDEVNVLLKAKEFWVLFNQRLVAYPIQKLSIKNDKSLVVKFKGIDSDEQVEWIKNKEVYLPLSALPKLADGEVYLFDLIDCMVVDEVYGEVGKVVGVNDQSIQRLLIVKSGRKEYVIPYIPEFISKIDTEQKTILTILPEGILDL